MYESTRRFLSLLSCSLLLTPLPLCAGTVDPSAEAAEETAGSGTEGTSTERQPPEESRNTLRWTTASEVDNFGYDIYRGESEEGPFERINPEPLTGAGTTDEATQYEYVDATIDPSKAYWYYVESISMSGERERFTPIFRAAPKRGDAGELEVNTSEEEAEGDGRRRE